MEIQAPEPRIAGGSIVCYEILEFFFYWISPSLDIIRFPNHELSSKFFSIFYDSKSYLLRYLFLRFLIYILSDIYQLFFENDLNS